MFAVIANGMQAVCKTQRKLDSILAVYPYPKFCRCSTEEEARKWLAANARAPYDPSFKKYGDTAKSGYAVVEYYIWDNTIYYNVYTGSIGFIKVFPDDGVKIDARPELLKIKVSGVRVNDLSISSHCVAIRRILKILGNIIDIDITVPDISVYLAAAKYTGKNHFIRGLQRDIADRLGGVSFTVSEKRGEYGQV
jgi:hypothetical protein